MSEQKIVVIHQKFIPSTGSGNKFIYFLIQTPQHQFNHKLPVFDYASVCKNTYAQTIKYKLLHNFTTP